MGESKSMLCVLLVGALRCSPVTVGGGGVSEGKAIRTPHTWTIGRIDGPSCLACAEVLATAGIG